jgi:hypothetical protein
VPQCEQKPRTFTSVVNFGMRDSNSKKQSKRLTLKASSERTPAEVATISMYMPMAVPEPTSAEKNQLSSSL